jgi:chitinase
LGMPTYGQSFTLENVNNNELNAKAPGPGLAGEFTRSAGFLAFYEICNNINNGGWTVVKDPEGRMGPYAYKDRQWVSYDE